MCSLGRINKKAHTGVNKVYLQLHHIVAYSSLDSMYNTLKTAINKKEHKNAKHCICFII